MVRRFVLMLALIMPTTAFAESHSLSDMLGGIVGEVIKREIQKEFPAPEPEVQVPDQPGSGITIIFDQNGVRAETVQPHGNSAVTVSPRPRARPTLEAGRSVRSQLKLWQFSRAAIAVCGENLFMVLSCSDAKNNLEYYTQNCPDVRTFLVILTPKTKVIASWFLRSNKQPRNPNLILFVKTHEGKLREQFVPDNPTAWEVQSALGCS